MCSFCFITEPGMGLPTNFREIKLNKSAITKNGVALQRNFVYFVYKGVENNRPIFDGLSSGISM